MNAMNAIDRVRLTVRNRSLPSSRRASSGWVRRSSHHTVAPVARSPTPAAVRVPADSQPWFGPTDSA